MKSINTIIVVLLAFVIFITLVKVTIGETGEPAVLHTELAISALAHVVGLFFVTISGLLILLKAVKRTPLEEVFLPGISLLAGLAILDTQWFTVIVVGLTLLGLGGLLLIPKALLLTRTNNQLTESPTISES